jgi:hypothetical protein
LFFTVSFKTHVSQAYVTVGLIIFQYNFVFYFFEINLLLKRNASYHNPREIPPPIPMEQQPPVGQGILIIDASWSQSDAPQSVEILRTSDEPDAETSAWQQTMPTRDRIPCRQDSNPQSQQVPGADHALDRVGSHPGKITKRNFRSLLARNPTH